MHQENKIAFKLHKISNYMYCCYLQASIAGVRLSSGEPRPLITCVFEVATCIVCVCILRNTLSLLRVIFTYLSSRLLSVRNSKSSRVALYSIFIDPSNYNKFAVSGRDEYAR